MNKTFTIINTVKKISLILIITSFSISAAAQSIKENGKKEKPSFFNKNEKLAKYLSVPNLAKLKNDFDYDISESISQSKVDEVWGNNYKYTYSYNSSRTEIIIEEFDFNNDESTWEYAGITEYKFTNEGLPTSIKFNFSSDVYTENVELNYYFSESILDSLVYSGSENEPDGSYEYSSVSRITQITSDSARYTATYTENGFISDDIEEGYFVQKGNDLVEVYENTNAEEGEYLLERYAYSGITFTELITSDFNEFFFVDEYNDEYYQNEGWVPYSRKTFTEETSFLTTALYEYFEDGIWEESDRYSYTYDNGQIIESEEAYKNSEGDWLTYYRTLYTYGGLVSNEIEEKVGAFKLSQNYPNPFNPTTSINFELLNSGFVSLKVYNILGAEVKTLVSENISAGQHAVSFDASNLPSGIYYYTINTTNFSEAKSMTLIK